MQVLVTGGAGFIGSCVVDRLLSDGHSVTVVDDLSRGHLSNLDQTLPLISFISADVRESGLAAIVRQFAPEVIFHLAAQVDVRASVADPQSDASINILGTINLAEAARAAHVRKIVFSSSGGSIYGQTRPPVTEDSPIDPLSPYAASKVASEHYLNVYSQLYGVQCSHLALANVYGPRQNPDGEAGVVAIFVKAMLEGRPTTVFGDGGNTRDYVYVDDVASAFLLAANATGDRRRFNIGTGIQTSDRELHAMVAKAVGGRDLPCRAPSRLGDVRASAIDASRARSELGWRPAHDLTAGIRATVDYFGGTERSRPPVTLVREASSVHSPNESTPSRGFLRRG